MTRGSRPERDEASFLLRQQVWGLSGGALRDSIPLGSLIEHDLEEAREGLKFSVERVRGWLRPLLGSRAPSMNLLKHCTLPVRVLSPHVGKPPPLAQNIQLKANESRGCRRSACST
jgi:hypothetical protein